MVWVIDRQLPRGVTGMLAARLVDAFRAPSIVVADRGEEASGSVRTLPGLPVPELLGRLDACCHGGEAMPWAGGFNLTSERLPQLAQRLQELAEVIDAVEPPPSADRSVDAEIPPAYLAPQVWQTADLFRALRSRSPSRWRS